MKDTAAIEATSYQEGEGDDAVTYTYTEGCLDTIDEHYQGVMQTPEPEEDPDGLTNVVYMPSLELEYELEDGTFIYYGGIDLKTGWKPAFAGSDVGIEYEIVMEVWPSDDFMSLSRPAVSLVFQAEDVAEDAEFKTEINTFELECTERNTNFFSLC